LSHVVSVWCVNTIKSVFYRYMFWHRYCFV